MTDDTKKWTGILKTLIKEIQHPTNTFEAEHARAELFSMAEAADKWNEHVQDMRELGERILARGRFDPDFVTTTLKELKEARGKEAEKALLLETFKAKGDDLGDVELPSF